MFQQLARLLAILGVTASGLTAAVGHATPQASDTAVAAIESVIAAAGASIHAAVTTGALDLTGLDLALTKADEHAADGLATATAAKAAGQAKGAAARSNGAANAGDHPAAPPATTPPVDTPAGPPADPGAGHRP
jgi:hypothetical protein